MTLKQQIEDLIRAEFPGTLTNQQIAMRLSANEPSVRRAVKQLEREFIVRFHSDNYPETTINWQARG